MVPHASCKALEQPRSNQPIEMDAQASLFVHITLENTTICVSHCARSSFTTLRVCEGVGIGEMGGKWMAMQVHVGVRG